MRLPVIFKVGLCCFLLFASFDKAMRQDEDAMQRINPDIGPPMALDQDKVQAAGIKAFDGKHIRLYTDLLDQPQKVQDLVRLFDAAVPKWCEYFEVDPSRAENWKVTGFLILERLRFEKVDLIPQELQGEIRAGFSKGHELWVMLKIDLGNSLKRIEPDDYYARHLLIHEGTHSFMQWFLGGTGPPWHSEGMAELLGLHRVENGSLVIGTVDEKQEETLFWGRPKIIVDDVKAKKARSLGQVMAIPPRGFRNNSNYGWAWAACKFLSQHPLSREQFAGMRENCGDISGRFSKKLTRSFGDSRPILEQDWQDFIYNIEYGYDVARFATTDCEKDAAGAYRVGAAKGWQNAGLTIEKGDKITIQSTGKFTIKKEQGNVWQSESGGVTIEYYRGIPLGQLMARIVPIRKSLNYDNPKVPPLPIAIGLKKQFVAETSGRLYFKINDHPAEIRDNEGHLSVRVNIDRK